MKSATSYVHNYCKVYKVLYERLNLLCLNHGKFGHYMEGYRQKEIQVVKEGDGVQEGEKNVEPNGIQGGSNIQEVLGRSSINRKV